MQLKYIFGKINRKQFSIRYSEFKNWFDGEWWKLFACDARLPPSTWQKEWLNICVSDGVRLVQGAAGAVLCSVHRVSVCDVYTQWAGPRLSAQSRAEMTQITPQSPSPSHSPSHGIFNLFQIIPSFSIAVTLSYLSDYFETIISGRRLLRTFYLSTLFLVIASLWTCLIYCTFQQGFWYYYDVVDMFKIIVSLWMYLKLLYLCEPL